MAFTFNVPLARKSLNGRDTLLFCAKNKFSIPHDLAGAILYADIIEGCKEQVPKCHGMCFPNFDTFLANSGWYLEALKDLGYQDIVEEYNKINGAVFDLVKKEYASGNDKALIEKIIDLLPKRYLSAIKDRESAGRSWWPGRNPSGPEVIDVEKLLERKDLEETFPVDSNNEIVKRGFAIEQYLPKNTVLFLGLNPSWPKDDKKRINGSHFYSKHDHPHFKRERSLVEFLFNEGLDYQSTYLPHHDLLFMRETKHSKVLEECKKDNDFYQKQINWSKQIIEAAEPVLIVAENSELRRIIFDEKKVFPFGWWDEELGVDFFYVGNRPTPILFTGMLSALNNGSFYSLRWHIQRILKEIR